MDDPLRFDSGPQSAMDHHTGYNTRNLVDNDDNMLHGWVLPHVPLRPRCAFRFQRRSL